MEAVVEHPGLVPGSVSARAHQLDALRKCLSQPTLVVLPTGQGKTAIAWMAIAEVIDNGGRAILVAPTNPLVDQHHRDLKEILSTEDCRIIRLSGQQSWEKRQVAMQEAAVAVATPQVIRNDAQRGSIDLGKVDLIVFDEAHHATGNHAMAQLGDLYRNLGSSRRRVLACTASPGSHESVIQEVVDRLGIERIHSMMSDDPLLLPYVQGMEVVEHRLEVPLQTRVLAQPVQDLLDSYLERLRRFGFLPGSGPVGLRLLRDSQRRISMAIKRGNTQGFNAARINADSIRIHNLLGLLMSQGPATALAFLKRMEEASTKEDRKQARFIALSEIQNLLRELQLHELPNPKLNLVSSLVEQTMISDPESKVIIFANYRDTVDVIVERVSGIAGVRPIEFLGQARKSGKGLSQKEQVARLQAFKEGDYNVLVATSVGEEGLDVPAADLVIFNEPVASEIRTIQRRGRTARHREGRVVVLVAEDTRDEGVRHASAAREIRMQKALRKVSRRMRGGLVDDSLEARLENFSVNSTEGRISAATWILNEVERLAPQLKESEEVEAPVEKVPEKSYKVKAEQLRPRRQMSIDSFMPQPDPLPLPSEDGDWSNPVLDGTEENKR